MRLNPNPARARDEPMNKVIPKPSGPPIYLPVETAQGVVYAVIPTGMSEEYFDFLLMSLDFHAKHLPGFIVEPDPQEPDYQI